MTNLITITTNTKRAMMKAAHSITRTSVKVNGGDYRATFTISLKLVHAAVNGRRIYAGTAANLITEIETLSSRLYTKMMDKKHADEEATSGIVEMHYSEYKNKYSNCKTVEGSYDKKTKTIKVITGNTTAKSNKVVDREELLNTNYGFVCVKHYTDGTSSRQFIG